MDILNNLNNKQAWLSFLNYKIEKSSLTKNELEDLKKFIENEEYTQIVNNLNNKSFCFSLPEKNLVNKMGSTKKRVVYTFNKTENYILKMIAFLLHSFDNIFCENLYSFRLNYGVKDAIKNLTQYRDVFCYKVDIKNYFNSINVNLLISKLTKYVNDENLIWFFKELLTQNKCVFKDEVIEEERGAMAGVPVSGFFANIFLLELDELFNKKGIVYARYSDDIIIISKTKQELEEAKTILLEYLKENLLEINESKEQYYSPLEAWEFLGISYVNGVTDISSATLTKIKGKIRRKARALYRWALKKNLQPEKAIKATIKVFNKKFYELNLNSELTWCKWFFPVINTDKSLKIIDNYFQENLRYIASGKHTKKNYKKVTYQNLKALGYKPLVNAYWQYKNSLKP